MKKLKRYETFENLKASKIATTLKSAAPNEEALKNLFANLRSSHPAFNYYPDHWFIKSS
jgi:hypothetical protein